MIFRERSARHAEDPLGCPGVDVPALEHDPVALLYKRDGVLLYEALHLGAIEVQIRGDLVNVEETMRHMRARD